MSQDQISNSLQAYAAWKADVLKTLDAFQSWRDEQSLVGTEGDLRIFETMEALRQDRLTIAFVAEFSRGKTELINAIFFADSGRRLLPSEAGRTTMCPTELFFDRDSGEAWVRLLPIETRRDDRALTELKQEPDEWVERPLPIDSPDQMAAALREVMRTREVPLAEARVLGLYDESQDSQFQATGRHPETVEIPVWRHALISYPHPLLKQGLAILDTPGLNALGTEPELTLNMLPAAQAVLFVLAADTGVTRSDLEMWQQHVRPVARHQTQQLVVAALNKIDTLWDDLCDDTNVDQSIERQRHKVSELLDLPAERIFPLSAQKGLLAKVRNDPGLLARSRLTELERFLADEVLPQRVRYLHEQVLAGVAAMQTEARTALESRLATVTRELDSLRNLRGKNAEVIQHLLQKSREEQAAYLRNVEGFQSSRRVLQAQARMLLQTLGMNQLDNLIRKTRQDMMGAWTTAGLKRAMRSFFEAANEIMHQAVQQSEQTRMLVRATYRKFHEEHGLPIGTPPVFSVEEFTLEFQQLVAEAEAYRNSAATTMTEQSLVIRKFFASMVSRARNIMHRAHQAADAWLRTVMNPLVQQIQDHKRLMEQRLDTLRRISTSRDKLDERILSLSAEQTRLRRDLALLDTLQSSLSRPAPPADARLVADQAPVSEAG